MDSIRGWFCFAAVLAVLQPLGANRVWADDSYQVFTFEKDKLEFGRVSHYDVVRYGDLELSREISTPQLPVKLVHLSLPPGKNIASIAITVLESQDLVGQYDVFPTQSPQVLSRPDVRFTGPRNDIYSSSDPFPKDIVKIGPRGYFSGYNVGALLVYPVQYVPAQKKLIFHSKIGVQILYGDSKSLPVPFKTTPYSEAVRRGPLEKLVTNPRSLTRPAIQKAQRSSALPSEEHLYVIATVDSFVDRFVPLVYWKNKKGLSATTVTTSWIYSNYSGPDNQAKIREFIKDAHQNWGTLWVLLGGDEDFVPARLAYAMDCEIVSPGVNDIPCDLYYSDLDGDWNANGNGVYGEVADAVDMYPDVFVGRAPVKTTAEVNAFVSKVMAYEMIPPLGHELDMLFLGEILWPDPYTDSGEGKDFIDSMYVPDRFDPITKLYESLGNENHSSVMSALNAGQNIVNHDGHAWYTVLGIGSGYLVKSDMDALTNGPRYSILFSIGCWPAAIDFDCIAEHFITNPIGGGVAFIGNSRYGWGSPGNPRYGYSDRFDQQFFKSLFDDGVYHIGNTLAAAKAVYVMFSGQENVYRWCEYEVNLLGDPEMPIWTDTPRSMAVTCPDELPVGSCSFPITVTDGNEPVAGALVCLIQNTDVYETGLTDNHGQAHFNIATSVGSPIQVTVTAQNFIPFEDTVPMVINDPYMRISSCATNGSAEGYVAPGDVVSVDACFKNYGSETAYVVSAMLRSGNGKIVMVDSTEALGDISPGDSTVITGAFSFQAGTDLGNGEVIYLNSELSDTSGNVWTGPIGVTGATPVISFNNYYALDHSYGDGDGFVEPGETVSLMLTVQNTGLLPAQDVSATANSNDPYLNILDTTLPLGNIPSSGQKQARVNIAVDASCPTPSFPEIDLSFDVLGGYQFADSFLLSVGEVGFQDYMENGDGNWTHAGAIDLWHLTSNRVHSGDSSWYCGIEGPFVYPHNVENTLELIPLEIGQNAVLSFWCWYEFTTYGNDGFYVETNDGSGWSTLDFIGSGGALGALTIGNDWLEYTYDLSRHPAGTLLTLRFRFVSDDEDVAEGVYIDDVTIIGTEWPEGQEQPIPTLTGWGMIVVTLLLLCAGTILMRRGREPY